MEKVVLHDKTFVPSISNSEIQKIIDQLAEQLNNDNKDSKEAVILLCILNGAIVFTGELIQRLDFPCQLVSTKMTSYCGTSTSGEVKQTLPLTASVKGRKVLILEDIIDTGYTLKAMKEILAKEGAAEVKVCTLLFKPDSFRVDEKIDYIGKSIPNEFIVGFGLDYDELGRNLKDIYTLYE